MGTPTPRYRIMPFSTGRRRLLSRGAVSAAALGVVGVVGCSSSNGNNNKNNQAASTAQSTVPSTPAGSTTRAAGTAGPAASPAAANIKKGGTLVELLEGPLPTLDPQANQGYITLGTAGHVYSRLLQYAAGPGHNYAALNEFAPDAAQGYEITDGGMTINFKLKPNVKFHAPLNRAMTSEDLVFTYQRLLGKTPNSKPSPNSGRFASAVDSFSAPDASTFTVKLKAPFYPALSLFAHGFFAFIMPKETDTTIDPTKTMVGSGAWMLTKYDPSTGATMTRNPQWHFGPDAPYFDSIDMPIIPDINNRVAQFLAGKVDLTVNLVPDNLVHIQSQIKNVPFIVGEVGFSGIAFSQKDANAPWVKDVRVRQAMSNSNDRDGTAEAAYSYSALKKIGINLPIQWDNFIPPAWPALWLDPQGKDIDPNVAKFFKFDPQAAKQLLSAAGFANGFDLNFHYPPIYGPDYTTITELSAELLTKIGINTKVVEEDYASVYTTQTKKGNYDGIALTSNLEPEGSMFLEDFIRTGGGTNLSTVSDLDFDQRLTAAQAILDVNKRKQAMFDLQNYLDGKMYYVPLQSSTGPRIAVTQTNIQNVKDYPLAGASYGVGQDCLAYWWRSA